MYRQTLGVVTDTEYVVLTPSVEPPPDEWPVTKSIHLFDNVLLKAEWHDISKAMSRAISKIDTSVLVGARLDYTVKYTQGLPIAEDAKIAVDGMNVVHEKLSKGEIKSGSVDLTGLIGREVTVKISFPSSPLIWSEVMFDIWVTLGYSEEPAEDPSAPPFWEDFEWYHWAALGGGALLLVYLFTGRKPPVIVVKG